MSKASVALCAAALSLVPLTVNAGPSAFRETPASGISITRTWIDEHQQVGETGVCAAFVNKTSVPATDIQFVYSLIAKDGKVLYSMVHDAKGQFDPGAPIQGENEATCDTAYGVFYGGTIASVRAGQGSIVASVSQVQYADGNWWHAGPDIAGAVLPQPGGDVQIVKAFSWEPDGATQECATFRIDGSRDVRKIHVVFSHIADDGSDVVDDPYDVYPIASRGTACRGWNGSTTPRAGTAPGDVKPEVLVFGKPARLVTWIGEVDFKDGTSWHAAKPDPSALSAAAAPSTVDYSQAVWWPNEVEVNGSAAQELASGVEIGKVYAWAFADSNECVDFENRSAKTIEHVRFLFSHLDADGKPATDSEPLDVHGSFQPGGTKSENCRAFDGNVVLASLWAGGGTSGTTFVNGKPSAISVRVEEVDFADGSSWHAP